MSDHKIEINGKSFDIPKEVFDLTINISMERDTYFEYLEYCHSLLRDTPNYPMRGEIEQALQMQREYKSKKQ